MYLTQPTIEAIRGLPADLRSEFVLVNPRTHAPFNDICKLWIELRQAAGWPANAWFHDTRRSYVTNARRRKAAERVIMAQTGHKTRAVFDRYNIVDDTDQQEAVRLYEAGLRQETRQGAEMGLPENKEGPEFPRGLQLLT